MLCYTLLWQYDNMVKLKEDTGTYFPLILYHMIMILMKTETII